MRASLEPARLAALPPAGEEWVKPWEKLRLPLAYDPTWAAPGAARSSHHAYPGGWAIHCAINLGAALNLSDQAVRLKGVHVDRDAVVAAMALHDWAKLKLLRWDGEHALDAEGSGGHHWMALAECMLRGFPPKVVQLLAGVHGGWWLKPETVEGSLRSAAQRIGIDLEGSAYLRRSEDLHVEEWIMRQAEESWYQATRRALQEVSGEVRAWHEDRELATPFERVSSALFSTYDELALYHDLKAYGPERMFERLDAWYLGIAPQ